MPTFYKNPKVSLRAKYRIVFEISLIVALSVHIIVFYLIPNFQFKPIKVIAEQIRIEQIDVPQTQQFEKRPPPSRPSIPIESESEDLLDDVTIEPTTIDEFKPLEAPPPPEQSGYIKFIAYDEPPEPIGGYAAIQRNIKYPEIAQEAGIEGTVIVHAFINKNGIVTETRILKGIPKTGLDEAAQAAIKKTKFKPAKQRDRPVGVWISIPVIFRLK
ncbi:MAG: energy transducer TonB [Fidelibacterota bacterium]